MAVALALDPRDRYRTGQEMRKALHDGAAGSPRARARRARRATKAPSHRGHDRARPAGARRSARAPVQPAGPAPAAPPRHAGSGRRSRPSSRAGRAQPARGGTADRAAALVVLSGRGRRAQRAPRRPKWCCATSSIRKSSRPPRPCASSSPKTPSSRPRRPATGAAALRHARAAQMLAALLNVEHLVSTAGYPLLFLIVMGESSGRADPGRDRADRRGGAGQPGQTGDRPRHRRWPRPGRSWATTSAT